MKKFLKGFSMVELLAVIMVLALIAWAASSDLAKHNQKKNYNLAVEADSAALEVISTGVTRWIDLYAAGMADNSTTEIDLTANSFRSLIPNSYSSNILPSGLRIKAFVRKSESYPGSGVQIPRAVIIPSE